MDFTTESEDAGSKFNVESMESLNDFIQSQMGTGKTLLASSPLTTASNEWSTTAVDSTSHRLQHDDTYNDVLEREELLAMNKIDQERAQAYVRQQ